MKRKRSKQQIKINRRTLASRTWKWLAQDLDSKQWDTTTQGTT